MTPRCRALNKTYEEDSAASAMVDVICRVERERLLLGERGAEAEAQKKEGRMALICKTPPRKPNRSTCVFSSHISISIIPQKVHLTHPSIRLLLAPSAGDRSFPLLSLISLSLAHSLSQKKKFPIPSLHVPRRHADNCKSDDY